MKVNKLTLNIWLCIVGIMLIGLVALYSATYENFRVNRSIVYSQIWGYVLGLVLMYGISRIDYRKFFDVAYIFYAINIVLLVLVLLAGRDALGAKRWLTLGPINFQPSELAKLALILALGRYFSLRRVQLSFGFFDKVYSWLRSVIMPFLITLLMMALIYKQPDLGTSLLFFGIFMTMLYVSGINHKRYIGILLGFVAIVPLMWQFLRPYQKDRLLVFLNPNIDPLGAGYTIIQSKIAIGSGRLWGKGWLAGTQNQLNFLPERHTDFIFSVIGEEWGLIGTMLLLLLYFALILTCLNIAEQVKDPFGVQVTIGIIAILTLQVIINIGMAMGLFPIVGLTLPMVSYGRSSLIVFMIMMGFMLNLSSKRTVF